MQVCSIFMFNFFVITVLSSSSSIIIPILFNQHFITPSSPLYHSSTATPSLLHHSFITSPSLFHHSSSTPLSLLYHFSITPSSLLHHSSITLPSLLHHSSITPPSLLHHSSITPPSLLHHHSTPLPSSIYQNSKFNPKLKFNSWSTSISCHSNSIITTSTDPTQKLYSERELFLMCLLFNRRTMARTFWKLCQDPMGLSLTIS